MSKVSDELMHRELMKALAPQHNSPASDIEQHNPGTVDEHDDGEIGYSELFRDVLPSWPREPEPRRRGVKRTLSAHRDGHTSHPGYRTGEDVVLPYG